MRCAPLVAALALAGCSASLADLRAGADTAPPPFIPEGLERVVIDPSGVRWQVVERRVFSAVSDSVDLWVQRADPGAPFGEARFTGLAPSCFGRPRWVTNPDSGAQEGACYLRRFGVQGGALLFQLRLGGDWVTAASVPLRSILTDSDGDGWNDATEQLFATRLDDRDSDRDGLADPTDPNPLVADDPTGAPAPSPALAMARQAVADSKACTPGKPLLVVGRDRLRQAFPGLSCTVLWRPLSETAAASRSADARGQLDRLSVDMAAREGGLARLLIELDDSDAARPVVRLGHLLGVEEVVFARRDDGYVQVDRRLRLRGQE